MNELSDEQIEDAFERIRAYFEAKGNETGLEILDSYEEQWAISESLSDRQIAWIEKQLSWSRRGAGPSSRSDAATAADSGPDNEAALLDAMIEQRLAAKGKRLVDDAQIARLKKAINDLDAALGGLGG